MKFQDMIAPTAPPKTFGPGYCLCCGNALPAGRVMMCDGCIDPNGAVARIARMLRGKYGALPAGGK